LKLALQTLFCVRKQWRHWLESLDAILARRWPSWFTRIQLSLAIYLLMTNIFRMWMCLEWIFCRKTCSLFQWIISINPFNWLWNKKPFVYWWETK
jgi:hypothetical protein